MKIIADEIHHEFLAPEELVELTGRSHRAAQVKWLTENGWRAEINAAGAPVVGRWYARMKLAGIDLASLAPGKLPDFAKIR